MDKHYIKLGAFVTAFLFLLISTNVFAQRNIDLHGDVFVLQTCDPLSVLKSNHNGEDYLLKSKLEINSKKYSSFLVKGINPLRYRYYINNEIVTQFMENASTSQNLVPSPNGNFLIPYEIQIENIFNSELPQNTIKQDIEKIKKSIDILIDTLRYYEFSQDRIPKRDSYYDNFGTIQKQDFKSNDGELLYKALDDSIVRKKSSLDRLYKEYSEILDKSPITETVPQFLAEYKDYKPIADNSPDEVKNLKMFICDFVNKYDSINKIIVLDSVNKVKKRTTVDVINSAKYTNAIKRTQMYKEFTISMSTKIAITLENCFRKLSEENNSIRMASCIEDSTVNGLRKNKMELGLMFDFIQKSSSELQVLASYLDLNDELFKNITERINQNYTKLLIYLKDIDAITESNSYQFTLPVSTNLRNIDLIRYTVEREDKISGNKQNYVYDFWIKGGIKIDFSLGMFASGLKDDVYSKYQKDDTMIVLNKQESGKYGLGFGAMVNLVYRNGASWLTPSLNFGVIYSNSQKLQLLSGVGLQLGKTERIILHGGLAFGSIQRIDLSQQDILKIKDNQYQIKGNVSQFNIPYLDNFQMSTFIGLTYNLSKKNALQAVTDKYMDKSLAY